jgi:hypothetical protein
MGHSAEDFAVRPFAGDLIGVSMAVPLTAMEEPSTDFFAQLDAGAAHFEAGLPL